jgi:hypothetical protein
LGPTHNQDDSVAKAALDKQSRVKDWTFHNLRRTMATGCEALGVLHTVTESLLNHVAGGERGVVIAISTSASQSKSGPVTCWLWYAVRRPIRATLCRSAVPLLPEGMPTVP